MSSSASSSKSLAKAKNIDDDDGLEPQKKRYHRIVTRSDSASSSDDSGDDDRTADHIDFLLRPGLPELDPILLRVKDLKPEAILDVRQQIDSTQLLGQVKWYHVQKPEYVPIGVLHMKCPLLLIEFYERRTFWRTGNTLEKVIKSK